MKRVCGMGWECKDLVLKSNDGKLVSLGKRHIFLFRGCYYLIFEFLRGHILLYH